jgi:hypothetical protein
MATTFPLFCWLALAVFLGCLGLLGLAVTKGVSPDGQGHARGFLGGCAAVFAVLFLCAVGVVGCLGAVTVSAVGTAVEKNPIRRIEIERSQDLGRRDRPEREGDEPVPAGQARRLPVQARFTVRGGAGQDLIGWLGEIIELDLSELEDALTVHQRMAPDGTPFDVCEFRLPLTERDLERFEQEIERELEGLELRLPERVEIEFEGAQALRNEE